MKKVALSLDSSLKEIFTHEESRAVFDKFLPGMRTMAENQPAALGFSVRKILQFSGGAIPDETADALDAALCALELYSAEPEMSDTPLTPDGAEVVPEPPRDAIYPGKVWRDTHGRRIQAHGGALYYEDGVYYWYGENKEKTDKAAGIWHWGVRYYASTDLYNWEDRGLLIPPVTDDPNSSLHPTSMMDRPHILYNARTQKYVCWLKIMEKDQTQTETVLTADSFFGPYTIVREKLRPLGMSAGDFDLAVAPDGKAYYFFERVHSETIIADLTEDYTDVTGYYSTHFPHKGPPHVREATAHFIRHGKHYLLTSGTTGYFPNPSEAAMADTWHGPYTVQGDPHIGDKTKTSFHSQISSVFKVPNKKDLYIACADRWMPNAPDYDYTHYGPLYDRLFDPDVEKTPADWALLANLPQEDTRNADYVWLPILFDGDTVKIEWRDSWKLEDYE